MNILKKPLIPALILALGLQSIAKAQSPRSVLDLTNNNWSIWLDTAAKWQNDRLYAPPQLTSASYL
ncbi:hypothetical protein C8P68_103272 [Mucilaginibacter yixingensis]|uniref:Uncharacterized protein n=1 Tax=Mucilaginibacter yixingensis TaxID=1295612 RepID=A0A2T5JB67_9SPHI|nr:hypothetical protein C8P68_103272 [Mucilaginibacter yixingensis]